jgi:hypothetical protein
MIMNRRHAHRSFAVLLILACALSAGQGVAQTVQNGSFEDDAWIPGFNDFVVPHLWSLDYNRGYSDGMRNDGGTIGPTPYGKQFYNLDGDGKHCNSFPTIPNGVTCYGHAFIQQAISGFTIGKQYVLSFAIASENPVRFLSDPSLRPGSRIFVTAHGADPGPAALYVAPYPSAHEWAPWEMHQFRFVPKQSQVTIAFEHAEPVPYFDYNGVGLDNVSVSPDCGPPPNDMVAWWPLDETAPTIAHEVIGGKLNETAFPNGIQVQPISYITGYTAGAYDFGTGTGYVNAGPDVGNFGGDFTVDAWVLLHPGRSCTGSVVDKEYGKPATTNMAGFQLFVNSANVPGCAIGLGGVPKTAVSSQALPANNTWHHLTLRAARVLSPGPPKVTTYNFVLSVDGQVKASNTVSKSGATYFDVSNKGDLHIGQNSDNQAHCAFGGAIDEVELYSRYLKDSEVSQLALMSKCKCRAEPCELIQFGRNDTSRQTKIRICNEGPETDIAWQIKGSPKQGPNCSVDGSVLQFVPSSGTTRVPTHACIPVDIKVSIPGGAGNVGLTSDQMAACFEVTTTTCGQSGIGYGRVVGPTIIDSLTECVINSPDCFRTHRGRFSSKVTWTVQNSSNAAVDLKWFARECPAPVDSLLGDSTISAMSVNGLPPGTPTTPATLHIPANGSASINVDVRFTSAQALASTRLQLHVGSLTNPNPGVAAQVEMTSDESCGSEWNGWAGVVPDSTPPSARSEGSIIYDAPNHRLVLFGGYDGAYRNDVWTTDLGPLSTWKHLLPSGSAPVGRSSHSAIYDAPRHRMIVFGGSDGGGYRNDVWALSLVAGSETWTQLAPSGAPPSTRRSHSAIYDPVNQRMIVFSGYTATNDVWALSLNGAPAWQELTPSGGDPSERQGHSAVYDAAGQRMIVFGGDDGSSFLNDVWALSLGGSPAWSQIVPVGVAPSARRFQYAALDSATRVMSIFGGEGVAGLSSEVWSLSLNDPSQWFATTPASNAGPGSRSVAMGPGRDVDGFFYLFGGLDSTGANGDLWALPGDRLCGGTAGTLGVGPSSAPPVLRIQTAPNPFHETTAIQFTMAHRGAAVVDIFDIAGRVVRKIDAGILGPGPVSIHWDGLDSRGSPARTGMYLVKVRVEGRTMLGNVVRVY